MKSEEAVIELRQRALNYFLAKIIRAEGFPLGIVVEKLFHNKSINVFSAMPKYL